MIHISETAIEQIQKFQQQDNKADWGLRLSVVGGGCSGMSYKLDFEKDSAENDKVFTQDGVSVFVDAKSFLFLKGMTLEYSGGLNGSGFHFKNPNASKTCGCGSSFAV